MEGLTTKQVEERKKKNKINSKQEVATKSIKKILFDNFFTLFNFINLFLGVAIFLVGSYKNMFFLGIVIINTAISTIQEIHAKKVIDNLSIINSSKAKVIRDGKKQEIPIEEIVVDDLLELTLGNQIVVDSIIIEGNVLVNESFITGEQDSVSKSKGEILLSGSYIVGGKCRAKVKNVGEDNYSSKITNGAKYVKKVNSEIMNSLNKIIKILSLTIIPIGLTMLFRQLNIEDLTIEQAVVKTVAAVIGMIPEGLVLLTSTVLAVSSINLAKSKVLVQEIYCIETLAKVDTLCLDKTGTLTNGKLEVKKVIPINKTQKDINNILANIAKNSEDENSTMQAIKKHFIKVDNSWNVTKKVAFNSKEKWSAISFENIGTYILGAPEIVLKENYEKYKNEINNYAKDYRVLVVAFQKEVLNIENSKYNSQEHNNNKTQISNQLPNNLEPIGYILILDKIRKDASKTLKYFEKQGVEIKIISGDNPITVSKIAKHVGIKKYDNYIDMTGIENEEEIEKIVQNHTIFGRTSPIQKRKIVKAMQKNGKTVAMTGDGVNDVLALKQADCSIAMANGSDVTKAVSELVLLDSNFSAMPKIVEEGRKTINNIQRSATLFLVKTIYSVILNILFLVMGNTFPFIPIQMSLISTVTIGLPSFILALEPNKERIHGEFLKNVIRRALPTALTVVINIIGISYMEKYKLINKEQYSSLCVIATGFCGIILLFTLSKKRESEKNNKLPISMFRFTLSIIVTFLFILGLTAFNWWFDIATLRPISLQIIKVMLISIIDFIILKFIIKVNIESN